MTNERMQRTLVWFKRDLRIHDHAALVAAQSHHDALALFVMEPEWLKSPECDARHVDFALACLAELRAALARRGMPLLVRVGSCVDVLRNCTQKWALPTCSATKKPAQVGRTRVT